MNAQELYAGEEYALYDPRYTRPRGGSHTPNRNVVFKVKLIKVQRRRHYGNEKRSTEATVEALEKAGYYSVGQQFTVPARQILDFWEDYESRWIDFENEQKRREEEERKREEELANVSKALRAIVAKKLDIDGSVIHVSYNTITIPRKAVERWLSTSTQVY